MNEKMIIQNLFPKMLDNTEYINDKLQIHICLVPFIRSTNTIIVKGEQNVPLIIFSMYRFENGKYIPNIDTIHSDKTNGIWLPSYINRVKQFNDVTQQIERLSIGDKRELKGIKNYMIITANNLKRLKQIS